MNRTVPIHKKSCIVFSQQIVLLSPKTVLLLGLFFASKMQLPSVRKQNHKKRIHSKNAAL